MDRALLDEQVSGMSMSSVGEDGHVVNLTSKRALADMRKQFVKERVNEIDMQFGRTLGCRISRQLGAFVDQDNHVKRNEMGWRRVRGKWRVKNPRGSSSSLEQKDGGEGEDNEDNEFDEAGCQDIEKGLYY